MSTSKKKRLVLFDSHAILHRAYHALPDFVSSKGEPTGALYGLATMIFKAVNDLKPDYMVAAYDLPEPTFRKESYKEYKAGRPKTDDELISQLERSKEMYSAFDIPAYGVAGFEADDVIGTVVEELKKEKDLEIFIVSGDMDTMQLIDGDRVVVYTLKKGINDTIIYDEKAVKERYGLTPVQLVDYKGLRGDPSDNIIGIPGVGEKTATELIQKFGSIEKIYKALEKGKEKLEAAGIKARMIELLVENQEEAEFSKVLATIRRDAPIDFKLPEKVWSENFNLEKAETFFRELDFRSLVGRLKSLTGVTSDTKDTKKEKEKEVEPENILNEAEGKEMRELEIAIWLIDSDKTTPTQEDVYAYAGTKDLKRAKEKILADIKRAGLEKVYNEIELPLIPILDRAKEKGIMVDKDYLAKISVDYHKQLAESEKKIFGAAGGEFNVNSPKQLSEVLFVKLGLKIKGLKKTGGGVTSTRESELLKLKDEHPIINEILVYREIQKLLSTYIDNLPKLLDEHNRLHTTLNQAGSSTGRMSSTEPNLQNIPARGGLGAAVRHAFIAPKGTRLVSLDYSQIEMRVLAVLSKDPELTRIFESGEDVHTSVASLVFGVKPEEVTKEMRRKAKVINFGIIYGMGVNALKTNLGSTREEAQKFHDDYFAKLPKIKEYFDNCLSEARGLGYTETMFGRRRYFAGIKSKLPFVRAMAERMAMNAPLQGSAADIVKLAITKADKALEKAGLEEKARLLLQVHDELIFEVEEKAVEEAEKIIAEAMESVVPGKIKFTVSRASGKNWGELK